MHISGTLLGLALFGTLCCGGFAQILRFGRCPRVTTKDNFDVSQYMGKWYEIKRSSIIFFELGLKCGQAEYSQNDDGTIKVVNKGYNKWFQRINTAEGSARIPNADHPAKLLVGFGNAMGEGDYWVVDTDYTGYTIVYSCKEYVWGTFHTDILWILGRERTMADEQVATLEANLNDMGVKTNLFSHVDQHECPEDM